MRVLDGSLILLLSLGLIFLVIGLFLLFQWFRLLIHVRQLDREKVRGKKNRKKKQRQQKKLQKKRRQAGSRSLILLVLAVVSLAGGFWVKQYEGTHLNAANKQSIVQIHYILKKLDQEMPKVKAGDEKAIHTVKDLSGRLASYGTVSAASNLNQENKILLNRYFRSVRELGLNLNNQDFQKDRETTAASYQEDVDQAQKLEKELLKQFHIDAKAFTEKKAS